MFEVDSFDTQELIFGADDNLPIRINSHPQEEFRKFCQFTVDATDGNGRCLSNPRRSIWYNGISETTEAGRTSKESDASSRSPATAKRKYPAETN